MDEEILCTERPLRPEEIAFVYGVNRQDERLNFQLAVFFPVDEVFGMEAGREDDVSVYANYDLKRGCVCGTLDVLTLEDDGSKNYQAYRLKPEEQETFWGKMDAYCRETTGKSLHRHEKLYRLEQGRRRLPPKGKRPDGMMGKTDPGERESAEKPPKKSSVHRKRNRSR